MKQHISPALAYSLLLTVVMVTLPHLQHLSVWAIACTSILLFWRSYITWQRRQLPKRWQLTLVTLLCVATVLIDFKTLFGREVGITLLVLVTALKLLEVRSIRDAMVLIHLSCFICITHFLYSQTMLEAAYMLLTLLMILSSWLQIQAPAMQSKKRFKLAAIIALQAIPIAAVLFVLFPRVQGPLWGMPNDAFRTAGLDNQMSPGSLNNLLTSDEIAFRAEFKQAVPDKENMYWRGPVFWYFDGQRWTPGNPQFAIEPRLIKTSQAVDYSITLEPQNQQWLFTLDMPGNISIPAQLTSDFQLLSPKVITSRTRYQVRSHIGYIANIYESKRQLERGLQLPAELNPLARQLAQQWRQQAKNEQAIVDAALQYFNQQGFQYTLDPPLHHNYHSIDEFLFQTKQGFCQHYSSAFVVLMRSAGIPARVVAGYQGGEFNQIGGYYMVRQSDAHAWAEVWLAGRGWVRVDPTAAIAPANIRVQLATQVNRNNPAINMLPQQIPGWMQTARMNWDALSNHWNQWILGYDQETQFAVLNRLGMEDVNWKNMVIWLTLIISAIVGIYGLFLLSHLLHGPRDPVQHGWQQISDKLAKLGLARLPEENATDYAQRVSQQRPELAAQIQQLAQHYNQLRYLEPRDYFLRKDFLNLVKAFRIH